MNKILTFVLNKHTNKLLLLLGSPQDPQYGKSFWYTVTGGVEDVDKSIEEAVKREIKEETNLDAEEYMYLNWIFKYNSLGADCTEYAYISFVSGDEIVLNEENIDYKWLDIDEYVNLIEWYGDKELLKSVLKFAVNKEVYFKEETVEEYYCN